METRTDEFVQGLYGSEFDKSRACGFCTHHNCYLTVKQLRQHNCLGKQCRHFVKDESHDWWHQREIMKKKRLDRKNRYNNM